MDSFERKRAIAPPAEGAVKVLIGTNVVESGANIPWLDAGVSCGTGKENGHRIETGATFLELIDLPQWRLGQQEGRVKRFCPGVFVLCSDKSFEEREQATSPEIKRLALTELVMHCAGLGLRTHELVFDYAPEPVKVREAESRLQRLGLIDLECKLTEAGATVAGLPVGPKTGAMLWHAKQLGCLGAMLPLAAVIEVGGLRRNPARSHGLDTSSDYLDAVLAFRLMYFAKKRGSSLGAPEGRNVSLRRSLAAAELMRDLEERLVCKVNFEFDDLGHELSQAILAGSLDTLFRCASGTKQFILLQNREQKFMIGQSSVVASQAGLSYVAGDLRVIAPTDKSKAPFTIIERVTSFGVEDIAELMKARPDLAAYTEFSRAPMVTTLLSTPSKIVGKSPPKVLATPKKESVRIDQFFDDCGAAYRRGQR
jgi:HrpA-like RNA helicase